MYVFTDGAATNNGYVNCRAGWAVFFSPDDPRNEYGSILIGPSNQKAELYAIKMALQKTLDEQDVTIVTDSQYSIDCLTKWCKQWEKNGWKTAKGHPVKHSTLIKECREMMEKHPVKFKHVNSHQISPSDKNSEEWRLWFGNDNVDKLANKGIQALPKKDQECVDTLKGKYITLDWEGNVVALQEPSETKKRKSKTKKATKQTKEYITIP